MILEFLAKNNLLYTLLLFSLIEKRFFSQNARFSFQFYFRSVNLSNKFYFRVVQDITNKKSFFSVDFSNKLSYRD